MSVPQSWSLARIFRAVEQINRAGSCPTAHEIVIAKHDKYRTQTYAPRNVREQQSMSTVPDSHLGCP
jgi:hypothetical protein